MKVRLDHFVIHIDPQSDATDLIAAQCEPLGFSFDPVGPRNFDSFSAHFLHVGAEYLEIVQLKKPGESGWVPQWVERFNQGVRGVYCLFLGTDNIECLALQLQKNGFDVKSERSAFVDKDGVRHPFPWRQIYMPPIPNTNIEISFIQYDASPEQLRDIYLPNSDENGLLGIHEAVVYLPKMYEKFDFLKRIFETIKADSSGLVTQLQNGEIRFQEGSSEELRLSVKASGAKYAGSFKISNVELRVN